MFVTDAAFRRETYGWPSIGLSALFAAGTIVLLSAPAEARGRHGHHVRHAAKHHAYPSRAQARARAPQVAPSRNFAAIVVDGNSGEELYGRSEDEPRHPASITKVMTLYLLFEQLEQGRLRLDSDIPISRHAATQKPTKLGLRPGQTIKVEDAIKAMVTRSANDIAVAVAEAVGGDEDSFAEMMTRKARELGMRDTRYVNASGLPADAQVTTARDLSILGRAVQERFPRYYRYFATRAFYYAGATIMNHNRLMNRVEGMDGIKTGYTNASGFNLLTSVKRDGRYIVAVVMGGVSAPARDRIMADLIAERISEGSTMRVASALRDLPARPVEVAAAATDLPPRPAAPPEAIARAPRTTLAYAASEPAIADSPQKLALAAVAQKSQPALDPIRVASISADVPLEKTRPAFVSGAVRSQAPAQTTQTRQPVLRAVSLDGSTAAAAVFAPPTATPSTMRWVIGPQPVRRPTFETRPQLAAKAEPASDRNKAEAKAADDESFESRRPAAARSGWMIQIGATEDIEKANALLARAKLQGRRALASALPFTEKVQRGPETLYRARFAGLEEKSADDACKALKQTGFSCFATKN